jgi:arylsulfatase A-like enzyme
MLEKRYFLYINFDGFGKYYYDLANAYPYSGTPNINKLMNEGVYFTNAWTGVPSITYPMQSAIVSGAYSDVTENVYMYYDKKQGEVVLCNHTNKAETIGEVLRRKEIPFVSIQQFTLEGRGAEKDNINFLYVEPGGDYKTRFDVLKNILCRKEIFIKEKNCKLDNIPQFLFLYIDDLDSIGHNPLFVRGKFKAINEKMRINNVITRLIKMDEELGSLLKLLHDLGIYENTNILLTTDHGMVPYRGKSLLGKLKSLLHDLKYENIQCFSSHEKVRVIDNTDVVIITTGIEVQLYFKNIEENRLNNIKNILLEEKYIEYCLTKNELKNRGTAEFFADLLVSPLPPYHFNICENSFFTLHGGHDSLNEKAQHIFAVIKGNKFKRNYIHDEKVCNIDFIPTVCEAFDLPYPKNSKGKILRDILY